MVVQARAHGASVRGPPDARSSAEFSRHLTAYLGDGLIEVVVDLAEVEPEGRRRHLRVGHFDVVVVHAVFDARRRTANPRVHDLLTEVLAAGQPLTNFLRGEDAEPGVE